MRTTVAVTVVGARLRTTVAVTTVAVTTVAVTVVGARLRTTVAVTVVGASRVEGLREAVQEVSREGVSRCQHVREAEAAVAVHGAQRARCSCAELQRSAGEVVRAVLVFIILTRVTLGATEKAEVRSAVADHGVARRPVLALVMLLNLGVTARARLHGAARAGDGAVSRVIAHYSVEERPLGLEQAEAESDRRVVQRVAEARVQLRSTGDV